MVSSETFHRGQSWLGSVLVLGLVCAGAGSGLLRLASHLDAGVEAGLVQLGTDRGWAGSSVPAEPGRSPDRPTRIADSTQAGRLRGAGWIAIGCSSCLAVYGVWRGLLGGEPTRTRRWPAARLPRPTPADESAWIQHVDRAIGALEGLASPLRGDVADRCLDSLRMLRAIPAEALLHHEVLDLTRSLRARGLEADQNPAVRRIWSAVIDREAFHHAWRRRAGATGAPAQGSSATR